MPVPGSAVGPSEAAQQARSEHGASAAEAGQDGVIRMPAKGLGKRAARDAENGWGLIIRGDGVRSDQDQQEGALYAS
jgi:hypothetical protein